MDPPMPDLVIHLLEANDIQPIAAAFTAVRFTR